MQDFLINKCFKKKSVLVIGDIMLDQYCYGSVKRISPEAPVPVLLKEYENAVPGGAANVAINLKAAGQDVSVMSITGTDVGAGQLIELLKEQGIDISFILQDKSRRTTIKTRFIGQNHQQMLRIDAEELNEIDEKTVEKFIKKLNENQMRFDLIVLSDYHKGLLTDALIGKVKKWAERSDIKIIADVKGSRKEKYVDFYLLKPNLNELSELMRMEIRTKQELVDSASQLRKDCNCAYILVTCGSKGMILIDKNGEITYFSSTKKEVFDVTGAGDTVLAYLAAGMANELSINSAVEIANYAAGIQVSKVGTSPVFLEEVKQELKKGQYDNQKYNKVVSVEELKNICRMSNDRMVFTNGCFDILHIGHIDYLRKAKELGGILVVGVNSDISVRRLKGNSRPINSENQRSQMLAALEFVDYVVVFEDDTPYELINIIRPDILAKGQDYELDEVVGKDIVESYGGQVVLLPIVQGISTTEIINKVKQE